MAGLLLSALGTAAAMGITAFIPAMSPLLVAIVLGMIVGNVKPLPDKFAPGINFASKRLLRVGIILLGLKLTIGEVVSLGPGMLVTVVAVVTIGILTTAWLGGKFGLTKTQSLLIACGFSICGAAAVGALDGVIDAKDEEVVTAVGLVVACGTILIPVLPLLGTAFGLTDMQTGLWAGASVHEVAQVVAIGGALGGAAMGATVVAKLARVMLLAPVMAVISVRQRKAGATVGKRPPIIPGFILGFIIMVLIRSTGLVPQVVVDLANWGQTAFLSAAMFAMGTGARIKAFAKLGAAPFALAGISTVIVSIVALAGVLLSS